MQFIPSVEGEFPGQADLVDVDQFKLCQRIEEFKGSYSGVTMMEINGNLRELHIFHYLPNLTKQIVHPDSSEVVFHVVFVV